MIAYLVSLAVFIPASGWLGDRFGGKRVLLTAIVVFTIGSALCGIAQNETELVLFRVIQGAGGGMMAPVGMAMLYRVFPPAERVRAASILTLGTTVAPAVGPVLGGFLVTNFSWRWVFFVNVPIGIVAVLFGALVLEKVEAIDAGRFDVPGFILGGAGLGLLMYGISEGPLQGWSSVEVIATCVSGAALLLAFVLVELRTTRPMVDLHLLRERLFRSTNCVMFLAAAAFLGLLYLIPLYFQDARGTVGAAVRPLHLPRGVRRHDRRPVRQPLHLSAHRAPSSHHRRPARAGRLHAGAHPDHGDDQSLAHPRPHVRPGLDDGPGDGARTRRRPSP